MTPADLALRAEALLAVGRCEAARDLLVAAGVPEVGDPQAAFVLANALLRLGDGPGARAAAEAGLRSRPSAELGLRLLALAHEGCGNRAKAKVTIERALAVSPTSSRAHLVLGQLRRRDGDLDGARAAIEEVLRLDPAAVFGHRELGRIALEDGDPHQARQHFLDALALDPEDPASLNELGIAELRSNRLRLAADRFRSASAVDPAGPGAGNHRLVAMQARRRVPRLISGILNPALGLVSVHFWWLRRRGGRRTDQAFGPVLWSGGRRKATARIAGTVLGWALLAATVMQGAWGLLPAVVVCFWLGLEVGARAPTTPGFDRRQERRLRG